MTVLEEYLAKSEKLKYFSHVSSLLYWDLSTTAPKKAKAKVSDSITYFETEIFKERTSDEYYNLVTKLCQPEEFDKLDDVMKFHIKTEKEELDKARRVPTDFFEEFSRIKNASSVLWPVCKQNNDWDGYKEALNNTIEAVKKNVKFLEPDKPVYDTLIDMYEKGMTQETIDRVFGELKEGLLPLIDRILAAPQPDSEKFAFFVPAHKQAELCTFLAEYVGMDMDCFSQSETEHPFSMSMSTSDVRVTNHFHENDITSAIFSVIHETGHSLFEHGIDPKYEDTMGGSVNFMGLHESQSRFYENILGRNENFWKPIWPKVVEIIPELGQVTLEEFVKEINHVKNSFIRTQADEVTYCLHVILRYEIERDIFFNGATVDELPALWNKKMEDYLHLTPSTFAEGVLQDMHWSDGSFGYFPSYLLGSIYDGMILEALEADMGSVDEILAKGDIKKVTSWLRENIHQHGSTRTSKEVLDILCKKPLSAKPLLKYFEDKYTKIYNL